MFLVLHFIPFGLPFSIVELGQCTGKYYVYRQTEENGPKLHLQALYEQLETIHVCDEILSLLKVFGQIYEISQ